MLSALVAAPVAIGAVYLGGWALAALIGTVAAAAAGEFLRMADLKGARPFRAVGMVAAASFVGLAAVRPGQGPDGAHWGALTAGLALVVCTLAIWQRGVEGNPLLAASATLFGAFYTGALLSFALFLRHLPGLDTPREGVLLVLAPLLLTWISDSGAYFAGRAWGRRKLIPRVSPGKTVEGSLGGLAACAAVGLVYGWWLERSGVYPLGAGAGLALGVLVSVAGQVGDLAESLLKRDAGVKDSGVMLPGHGGALDRVDSLLFTLPLAYAFLRLIAP